MNTESDSYNHFPLPDNHSITVYSKSGCSNCLKIKELLKKHNLSFIIINCDEFLLENRNEFLKFLTDLSQKEEQITQFPVAYYKSLHIGGVKNMEKYINSLLDFNEIF
jgi:glutaredoxin